MTLRFVKTSILVSEDGIDFSKETPIESEETRTARLARESAANKPLYQQLAEQRQKKQDDYDANTKLLFSAPKALDEEEYHFLESLQDAQEQAERHQKEEEEKALEIFRAARKVESSDNSHSQSKTQTRVVLKAESSTSNGLSLGMKVNAIRVKRKVPSSEQTPTEIEEHSYKRRKDDSISSHTQIPSTAESNTHPENRAKEQKKELTESKLSGLDLLNGYGSDDE